MSEARRRRTANPAVQALGRVTHELPARSTAFEMGGELARDGSTGGFAVRATQSTPRGRSRIPRLISRPGEANGSRDLQPIASGRSSATTSYYSVRRSRETAQRSPDSSGRHRTTSPATAPISAIVTTSPIWSRRPISAIAGAAALRGTGRCRATWPLSNRVPRLRRTRFVPARRRRVRSPQRPTCSIKGDDPADVVALRPLAAADSSPSAEKLLC